MISLHRKYNEYANNPAVFRADLMIDVSGSVKRYGDVADDWQKRDSLAVDPGLLRCIGRSENPNAIMRSYWERPRGHAKTFDVGLMATFFCTFANGQRNGYIIGTDSDVSGFTRDAVNRNIRLNPELGDIIEVNKNVITNIAKGHPGYGTRVELLSNDVASSWGILPDFVLVDEYTHWAGDGTLWGSIISSVGKRTNCLLMVIANAGFVESWQWSIREAIREDPSWYFSRLDGPVASWMSDKMLAEQRRMLPGLAYNRVWLNEWSSAGGDALTKEDINAAFLPELQPMSGRQDGWNFVAGLDLGLTRDCSAIVVLAVPTDGKAGKIRLAHHKLWRPTLGKKINLLEVERYILELDEAFGLEYVGFDPWQAEHLAATLDADSNHRRRNQRRVHWAAPWMREIPPVAANLREQATLTIEFFNDHRLQLFDCEPLRRDLHKLRVEEKSYGPRLVSPRTGEGHGDSFSALGLALLMAHELSGKRRIVVNDILSSPSNGGWEAAWQRRLAEHAKEQELDRLDMESMRSDHYGLQEALRTGEIHRQITVTEIPNNFHFGPFNQ